ncbi:hypothetical protein [Cupriavidus pauculus]|uniref:hypothetical protein n=1 Tax=Cupriavidus pauculus TaxID=82633 RepID=UPI0011AFC692|nr:hypothetical protein [Cupriavidus pauculus]
MDKRQLLELIQSLPDDLSVQPLELSECKQREHSWEAQCRTGLYGGVYQRNVDNTLTLRLDFKTREEGEFRRTHTDPDGGFRNLRRIA